MLVDFLDATTYVDEATNKKRHYFLKDSLIVSLKASQAHILQARGEKWQFRIRCYLSLTNKSQSSLLLEDRVFQFKYFINNDSWDGQVIGKRFQKYVEPLSVYKDQHFEIQFEVDSTKYNCNHCAKKLFIDLTSIQSDKQEVILEPVFLVPKH